MQLTLFIAIILASVTSARDFTLYDDVNYGGAAHRETRNSNAACCMLTIHRDCQGSNWLQRGIALTVPAHLSNHIWSFHNQC
ncbi:hypothetical protein N657DRAFT_625329 [Parathielavia appendiculata]|uniref:Uncharacterized protein n=1 Tax=Parathielavia appendiculata TaxID=2587402 RepID=A0AAN6TTD9_9PEZI|nr:hypothetical protein N657DRAFT_625329 [Parathielavia appendiculata]